MNTLRFYGTHFLEALAIYFVQAAPVRIWITLGPREVIIKQIVENLQPDIPVQMFQPLKREISFDRQDAYILFGNTSWFQTLLPALLEKQPFILALMCDKPGSLNSFFSLSGVYSDVITTFEDLAQRLKVLPKTTPEIMLIDTSTQTSTGDLITDWIPEEYRNTNQNNEQTEVE